MKQQPPNDGLPASIQTEVTILGAMLLDIDALQDATETLHVEDFSLDSHQRIYRAILSLWQDGDVVNHLTVWEELKQKREIDAIGGPAYLAFLTEGIPRNPNVESYVRIVKEKSLLRKALAICNDGMIAASDQSEDPRIIITDIQRKLELALDDIQEELSLEQQAVKEMELIRRQRLGEIQTFVTSGLEEIDFTHGGFALGELTVIGARPGIGKSTLLRGAVRANCLAGNFSHLITPEMSAGQVLRLFASWEARVPFRQVRHADRLTDATLANVEAAMRDVMRWPLRIDDKSPISGPEVIALFRSVKRRKKTKLGGLDYLQKLRYGGKAEHRHIYVTDAMVGMSSLAKTENMAVVAISSLTEPSGKDRNRPPTMEDFRQSGDIKYEANTGILLHREIDNTTQRLESECSLIFGKARSDEGGVKTIYFNSDFIYFQGKQAHLEWASGDNQGVLR